MSAFGKFGAADEAAQENACQQGGCAVNAYQRVGVSVPVTLTPYATVGEMTTTCCGDPKIIEGEGPCEGTQNGSCSFTISQTLCMTVPVTFGCDASVGGTTVNSLGVCTDNPCTNCSQPRTGFRL